MTMTKQERLQALASELRTDDQWEFWIEYALTVGGLPWPPKVDG